MSQGTFSNTLIPLESLEAFKRIFVCVQKSSFFQGLSPGFLVKND